MCTSLCSLDGSDLIDNIVVIEFTVDNVVDLIIVVPVCFVSL